MKTRGLAGLMLFVQSYSQREKKRKKKKREKKESARTGNKVCSRQFCSTSFLP